MFYQISVVKMSFYTAWNLSLYEFIKVFLGRCVNYTIANKHVNIGIYDTDIKLPFTYISILTNQFFTESRLYKDVCERNIQYITVFQT